MVEGFHISTVAQRIDVWRGQRGVNAHSVKGTLPCAIRSEKLCDSFGEKGPFVGHAAEKRPRETAAARPHAIGARAKDADELGAANNGRPRRAEKRGYRHAMPAEQSGGRPLAAGGVAVVLCRPNGQQEGFCLAGKQPHGRAREARAESLCRVPPVMLEIRAALPRRLSLAVTNLRPHATFLAADFATALTAFLRSHATLRLSDWYGWYGLLPPNDSRY